MIIDIKERELSQISQKEKEIKEKLRIAEFTFIKKKKLYEQCLHIVNVSHAEFKKILFRSLLHNKEKQYNDAWIVEHAPEDHERLIDKYRQKYLTILPLAEKEYSELTKLIKKLHIDLALKGLNELSLQEEIKKVLNERAELEPKLIAIKEIELDKLPAQISIAQLNGKAKYRPQVRSYSGGEILKMEFDTLRLDDELGRFLGRLQRERCAIALTGDSGAGKSTFSYQLAKAFLKKSFNVSYFALETGFTETVKQQIEKHKINQYKFEAFSEGTLEDVRRAAAHFDCVVIDSYSKISTKPEDFESLRQDFPNTFFIIIFQKTTDGKIRGGSSILFNSTATIDIQVKKDGQRIAFMQKSRYETENFVYSINNDRLLKADKTPVDWAEMDEKYL